MLSSVLSKLSLSRAEGSFLSPLKFTSCLGQGGFGIVFKAVDANPSSSSQATAVKFMFPDESNEKEQQQILRECKLASIFNHDNIVQILNVEGKQLNVTDIEKIFKNLSKDEERSLSLRDTCIRKAKRYKTIESICIQMPLCGENLRKWLQQGHNKDHPKIKIMQIKITHGIVSGLKYLHDKKIVHRDLKPENVMFSHENFQLPVKIGDFGLCRTIHSTETQTNTLTSRAGTGEYMAPEAFTNDYSFQADLFSLGLVIWEVFQLIPFHDRKPLFDKLVNDKREDLVAEMSMIGVREIVLSLTRRNKADRTESVDEIVGIFEAVHTSKELRMRLKRAAVGDRIILGEGLYEGEFVVGQDNVEIVGVGSEKTVLKGLKDKTCLQIRGNGCKISDIKVIFSEEGSESIGIHLQGSRNTVRNVEASGGGTGFHVLGEGNKLENLAVSDAEKGISLEGCRHIVDHVKFNNIRLRGIEIWSNSDHNEISNVIGTNVKNGIWVDGSSNNFCNIDLVKLTSAGAVYGMCLFNKGSSNTVTSLTCSGYSRVNDWGLEIYSADSTVKDSKCGPVWVRGTNTTFTNVDCGEEIKIGRDAIRVNLTNCRGQLLKPYAPRKEVTTTNCNFIDTIQE